ncbi:MAG: TonB-dependent receptor [Gammaproteobacteria bacterium]
MDKIFFITLLFLNSLALEANTDNTAESKEEAAQLEEIVISESSEKTPKQTIQPFIELTGDELRFKTGQTLGETLKNELGINNESFGAGVGRPVIRGQAGPRVRVMQNGLGNNDVSSLSPDHANGVEPILAERIEVLRGPGTLLYGNGAIGGVVNVIDNRIPERMPDKPIGGAAEQRYDSTTNESASAMKAEGGVRGLAFHIDGFYRDQNNTHIGGRPIDEKALRSIDSSFEEVVDNPDGLIRNSQARSRGGSVGVSMIGDDAMTGIAINRLEKVYGIPADGSGGDPVTIDLSQTKYDFKGNVNKPFPFAEKLKMKFGFTDYKHVELDGGIPATTFLNQSYESRLELEHSPVGPLNGVVGFQSINSEFSALGEEALVPKSDTDSYGLFAVETVQSGPFTYEAGARGEWQTITPENSESQSYLPVSGAGSISWDVNKHHELTLAFTHFQRAPQIQELFSNGVHEATHSFELGDANLNKEFSNNLDLGYRFNSDWMRAEISLFHNWIVDYIFQKRTGDVFDEVTESFDTICPADGECLPVFVSSQADAVFRGYEAKTVFPLMENRYGVVDLTLFSDYTRGSFIGGGDVPRMPPLRFGFQLDYAKNDWSANVRLTRGEPQNRTGDNESATRGYLQLDLGAQYQLADFNGADILVFAKGKNLLNENIRNSTSYLRNFAPEPGRSGEIGIRISY